ncbi:hypothetical protein [Chitinophaga sp. Ak27]|uniref:hypothetical protein n=1 Tax=Chitinophaga sp. Ak27 TaxID=2726116 RepID=UPI00145D7FA9|nr:hypothetical protein [Chitinophaga sp. Ak27]NLU94849.1 hypothetical protein [Chitinophaga sp. Ak27]
MWEEENKKIEQLERQFRLLGYSGADFHINGLEQGTLAEVIRRCLVMRNTEEDTMFKDPVVINHFSYNTQKTEYMVAAFAVELGAPGGYRVRSVTLTKSDGNIEQLAQKTLMIQRFDQVPGIGKARAMLHTGEGIKGRPKKGNRL